MSDNQSDNAEAWGPIREVFRVVEADAQPVAPPVKPPVRALRLVLEVGADSRRDMASALIHMAHRIEREELAGNGTWGGYSDGGNWELLTDPTMTHERFFAELTEYLRRSDKAHGITQEGE